MGLRNNSPESVLPNVQVGILRLEQARREEQREIARRLGAEAALMDTFEVAGNELAALWQSGECSPEEILMVEGRLRELDPSRRGQEPDPAWIADRFALLTDGEPAYDLHLEGGTRYSGIIKGDPFDFNVTPSKSRKGGATPTSLYTAYTRFKVPLFITSYMREQTAELSGFTLRYGLIGREAIAQAATEATFKNNSDLPTHRLSRETNYSDLKNLREFISEITEFGVEPFDTAPLDEALMEATEYRHAHRPLPHPSMYFPTGPLR